jgi:DNA-binding CsgD family transcriptional regulator
VAVDASAGLGKTALLAAARGAARDAGLLPLAARGAELERDFAFGVVRQLFDPVVRDEARDRAALFAGTARFAAPLLDVDVAGAPAVPPEDPFAARHALAWLTANLADDRPLALLVDDAQWADGASLGALAHLAHRLDGLPVALVVAARPEERTPALHAVLDQATTTLSLAPLGADAAAAVVRAVGPDPIRPRTLSVEATARLVAGRLGRAADPEFAAACHQATGGNPFLLRELARSGAADPAALADVSPDRVTREVAARLARLEPAAGRLARAVAVLGGGVALREAAALAEVPDAAVGAAVGALVDAGVLGSADPAEFLHPLVGAAVYAGVGPGERWEEHARAARLLAGEGASPERVAAQLLRCRPAGDGWAYERLVAAARLAGARGAAEAAVTYLRRALDEPAPAADRPALLVELGQAEVRAADPTAAVRHLREGLAGDVDASTAFGATLLLAGLLGHAWQVTEAVALVEEQIAALADEPALRATAEAALVNLTRIDPTVRARTADLIPRLRARVDAGAEEDPAVLGTIAAEMAMAAVPADATAAVAERALRHLDTGVGASEWSGWNAIRALVIAERYDVARAALDRALELALERGAVFESGSAYVFRAELHLRAGALDEAEADARTLLQISTQFGWPMGLGFATAWLGTVLLVRGEMDEAAALYARGPFALPAPTVPRGYPTIWVLFARARLRLAQDRLDDAIDDLRETGRRAHELAHVNPALAQWRAVLAGALARRGETEEPAALLAENVALARRFGAPGALGTALVAAATAEPAGPGQVAALRAAVAVLDRSDTILSRAYGHIALGVGLHAAGDAEGAREPLRHAVDLAHRSGAVALEDEALGCLRATGARPRRPATTGAGALTPSERRIAGLAAEGRQNREIAEALFVTTSTVEFHLRHAYRKLGIRGRAELAVALAG